MKVAILYICTGSYSIFWESFYISAEKYLLIGTGYEKHYYVFTDCEELDLQDNLRVHKVHQPKLGWPSDTLMRFEMFLKVEKDLAEFDYIYFFNANMLFVDYVGEEILPDESEQGLVAAIHPAYFKKNNINEFPYDRNPESTAYIPFGEGRYYFQGAFNGGQGGAFLTLIKTLSANTNKDLKNNIIALVHDESHLNRYLLGKSVKVLSPAYLFPEDNRKLRVKAKIIQRDKNKWGGHSFLRGIEDKPIENKSPFFSFVNRVKEIIINKRRR